MRGLKQISHRIKRRSRRVASFTDAWIETYTRAGQTNILESHLLQMRGLKQPNLIYERKEEYVASFTDAWIETLTLIWYISPRLVASFTDAWIETLGFGL